MFRITAHHDQAFGEAKFARLKKAMEEKYGSQCEEESCSIGDLCDQSYELGFRMEHQLDEYVRLMVLLTHYPPKFDPAFSLKRTLQDRTILAEDRLHVAQELMGAFDA